MVSVMTTLVQELNTELAGVVGDVGRSLVQIQAGTQGAGAGTIWHPYGLVLTNAHVASQGALQVTVPGRPALPARVLAQNDSLDLAALSIDARDLPSISLGDSQRLRPGELVLALGHPWGVLGAHHRRRRHRPGDTGTRGGAPWLRPRVDCGGPPPEARPFKRALGGRPGQAAGRQHGDGRTRCGHGRARPRGQGLPAQRAGKRGASRRLNMGTAAATSDEGRALGPAPRLD